jgi:LacI family transcriptional regulator
MFFCSKIKSNATKLDGYKKALKENNIEISEDLIIEAEQEKNTAEKLINYFEKGKFTAISATSDELALKLISFFAKNNIKTPEDIAIIGFDDLPFCKNINPTLSSVRQPMEQHAKNTLKLLMELLDGKEKSDLNKAIAKTRLICRESCGCKIKQEFNDDYFNLRIQR